MFAWATQYVLYILGAVIVVLLILCSAQTVRLRLAESAQEKATALMEKKDAQLQAQLASVRQLAEKGEELTLRINSYSAQAAANRESQRKAEEDMRTRPIPAGCDSAINWAITVTPELIGGWR